MRRFIVKEKMAIMGNGVLFRNNQIAFQFFSEKDIEISMSFSAFLNLIFIKLPTANITYWDKETII